MLIAYGKMLNYLSSVKLLQLPLARKRAIAVISLVCLCASTAFAQVSLTQFNINGLFDGASKNGVPEGWESVISSSKVKFLSSVSNIQPRNGNTCLKLTCSYPDEPQVYGLVKTDIACEPMTEYHFSVYIKSDNNDGKCWFGGGAGWGWYNAIPIGTYGWTRFDGYYRTGADETSFPFLIKAAGNASIYIDDLNVVSMGPASDPTIRPKYQTWNDSKLQSTFLDVKEKTPDLRNKLEALKKSGAHTDYAMIKLSMVEAFIPSVDKKLKDSKYQQACTVMLDEMEQLLTSLQKDISALDSNPKSVPAAYRYRTGKISYNGFTQIADVIDPSTGKIIRRPVILNGFGHFFTVGDEIPKWQDRGCNFIQMEQGPNCVSAKSDGTLAVDMKAVDNVVAKLKSAVQYNVGVTFLISPHYLPDSAGGPYWGDNPSVWAYYDTYLSTILPRIKDIPSIHSITLSNEPHSYAVPSDPLLQDTWHKYLTKKYSNIAALNTTYNTSYADFADVPIPPANKTLPSDYTHNERPWIYDWERCNELRFAAWHKRMADLVHKYAPNLPVQAKVTGGFITGGVQADGVDPEMFASFTDYCGFDDVGGLRIIYDMDPSFQKAPIINSENHLISPDITYDVLDDHRIYSDIFVQAMHGQTASAAWTYEPYSNDGLDMTTFSIRPAEMEAVARCGMDLMRIAPAMDAIQNSPRKVAIIYSPTSLWYDDQHHPIWHGAWDAFSNTGLRVRFLSEKQLQAGQFGDVKVLILPETQVVEPATINGISKFVKDGGKVIAIGHNLEYTPGWVPIDNSLVKSLISYKIDSISIGWEKQMIRWVKQAGVKPDIMLASSNDKDLRGIHWLSGTLNGKKVVSIVNTSGKTVDISITSPKVVRAWDMIADKEIKLPATLSNYGTLALQIAIAR